MAGAMLLAKGGEEHLPSGWCLFVLGEFGVQAGLPMTIRMNPWIYLQPQKSHKLAQHFDPKFVIFHQMMTKPI